MRCQHCGKRAHDLERLQAAYRTYSDAYNRCDPRSPEGRAAREAYFAIVQAACDASPEPCVFAGCVSRDRHWHGPFPGGYENPADPNGPPIEFTAEPAPGVRDYNGALLP